MGNTLTAGPVSQASLHHASEVTHNTAPFLVFVIYHSYAVAHEKTFSNYKGSHLRKLIVSVVRVRVE